MIDDYDFRLIGMTTLNRRIVDTALTAGLLFTQTIKQ